MQLLSHQPDQQLADVLRGLAPRRQLVSKGQHGRCHQPPLAGAEH